MMKNTEMASVTQPPLSKPPQHAIISSLIQKKATITETYQPRPDRKSGIKSPTRLLQPSSSTKQHPRSLTQQAEYYRKISNQYNTKPQQKTPAQPTIKSVARNYQTQARCLSGKVNTGSVSGRHRPTTKPKSSAQANLSTGQIPESHKLKESPSTGNTKNMRPSTQGICFTNSSTAAIQNKTSKQVQSGTPATARAARRPETSSVLQPVLSQRKKQNSRTFGGFHSEQRQQEPPRLLIPQSQRKLKRLASPSSTLNMSKDLNKSTESVSITTNKARRMPTSAQQLHSNRIKNSNSACGFSAAPKNVVETARQPNVRNGVRYQKLTRLNTTSIPQYDTSECDIAGVALDEHETKTRSLLKTNSPMGNHQQSEPFEISPLRDNCEKQSMRHTLKPGYPQVLTGIKQHAMNGIESVIQELGINNSDYNRQSSSEATAQSDINFTRSFIQPIESSGSGEGLQQTRESNNASSFRALPRNILTNQTISSSQMEGGPLNTLGHQQTENTMTFAQLPSATNDQTYHNQEETPENLHNKLKVAMINLTKEDVLLSHGTTMGATADQGRLTVPLGTSQEQTVSLLGNTTMLSPQTSNGHNHGQLLSRLGHSIGDQSQLTDCMLQTNVIDICISSGSPDGQKHRTPLSSQIQKHIKAGTTPKIYEKGRLSPSGKTSSTVYVQSRPQGFRSFLSKTTPYRKVEVLKDSSAYSQVLNYGGDSSSQQPTTQALQQEFVSPTTVKQASVSSNQNVSIASKNKSLRTHEDHSVPLDLTISPLVSCTKTAKSSKSQTRKSKTRNNQNVKSELKSYMSPIFQQVQKAPTPLLTSSKSHQQTRSLFMNGCAAMQPPSNQPYNASSSPYAQKSSPARGSITHYSLKSISPRRNQKSNTQQSLSQTQQPPPSESKTSTGNTVTTPNDQKSLSLFAKPKFSADVARHVIDAQSLKQNNLALQHSKSSVTIRPADRKASTLQRTSNTLQRAFHSKPSMIKPTSKPTIGQEKEASSPIISIPNPFSQSLESKHKIEGRNQVKKNSLVKSSTGGGAASTTKNRNSVVKWSREKSPFSASSSRQPKKQLSKSFQSRSSSRQEKPTKVLGQAHHPKKQQYLAGVPKKRDQQAFNSRQTIVIAQENSFSMTQSSSIANTNHEEIVTQMVPPAAPKPRRSKVDNLKLDIEGVALANQPLPQQSLELAPSQPKVVTIHIDNQYQDDEQVLQEKQHVTTQDSTRSDQQSSSRRPRSIRQLQNKHLKEEIILDESAPKEAAPLQAANSLPNFYPAQVSHEAPQGQKPTKPHMPSRQNTQLAQVCGDDQVSFSSASNFFSISNVGHSVTQSGPSKDLAESQEQIVVTKVTRRRCLNRYRSFEDKKESEPPSQMEKFNFNNLRDLQARRVQKTRSLSHQKRLLYQKFLTVSGASSTNKRSNKSCEEILVNFEQQKAKSHQVANSSISDEVQIDLTLADDPQVPLPQEEMTPLAFTQRLGGQAAQIQMQAKQNFEANLAEGVVATEEEFKTTTKQERLTTENEQGDLDDDKATSLGGEEEYKDDLLPAESPLNSLVMQHENYLTASSNLLDNLSKQLEKGMLGLDDDNLLGSAGNLLLNDDSMVVGEEDDLLQCGSQDDTDMLDGGTSDREAILNMLDDPINDEIGNSPYNGLVTPKTKESMNNFFSTPNPQMSTKSQLEIAEMAFQNSAGSSKESKDGNRFGFDLKKSLSIISEEKSVWLNGSVASLKQFPGGTTSIGVYSCSNFNSAQKSQHLYLRRDMSSMQKQQRYSEGFSEELKGSPLVREDNCNPFMASSEIQETEGAEEELKLKRAQSSNQTEIKRERANTLGEANHGKYEMRYFNSERTPHYGDDVMTLESRPSFPLAELQEEDYN